MRTTRSAGRRDLVGWLLLGAGLAAGTVATSDVLPFALGTAGALLVVAGRARAGTVPVTWMVPFGAVLVLLWFEILDVVALDPLPQLAIVAVVMLLSLAFAPRR